MNRTIVIALYTLSILLYPLVCSSYLIELKNQSSFQCRQYWEEGDQIKFYYYGGVVGVDKALVQRIRDSDTAYLEEAETEQSAKQAKAESISKKVKEKRRSEPKEDFLIERAGIMIEIQAASVAYKKARAGTDPEELKKRRKAFLSLQTKLSDLRNKAKAANGGKVPAAWDEAW